MANNWMTPAAFVNMSNAEGARPLQGCIPDLLTQYPRLIIQSFNLAYDLWVFEFNLAHDPWVFEFNSAYDFWVFEL